MKARTLRRYWPWWIALGWLLGYEGSAIAMHLHTLSELVWTASARWPALPFVVIPFVAILVWHFWFGLGRPRR